jgi:hypothetical protein
MIPTWVVLTPFAAIGAAYLVLSRIAKRREDREDREWAAGIAQGVHDAEYLRWLDKELFPEESEQT